MPPVTYVRTDTADDAVASLELAADFFSRAADDARYWKWYVVAVHAGVQGVFALALEGGNGLLVQKPGVAERTLAAHDAGTTPPPPHMDNFLRLYKKLQQQSNLRTTSARPLPASEEGELALSGLDALRDEFLHFNVKSWSIERALLIARSLGSLQVARFVAEENGAILWHEQTHSSRCSSAINRLLEQLQAET
jgi:hypothetical protein